MITAKQAAEISNNVEDSVHQMQMQKVEQAIRTAAQKGWKECDVPFAISARTKEVLESKEVGYTTRIVGDFRDGQYTEISWEEKEEVEK